MMLIFISNFDEICIDKRGEYKKIRLSVTGEDVQIQEQGSEKMESAKGS
jgi:hypothetical protein